MIEEMNRGKSLEMQVWDFYIFKLRDFLKWLITVTISTLGYLVAILLQIKMQRGEIPNKINASLAIFFLMVLPERVWVTPRCSSP